MKCQVLGLLVLLGVAASGCSSMKIHTDFDPAQDFSAVRTWAWSPGPNKSVGGPAMQADTLFTDRVMRAVEREMAAKGFTRAERDGADVQLSFFLVVEDKVNVTTVNNYYGYGYGVGGPGYHSGWGYGPGGFGSHTVVDQYQQGSLIIDVATVDPVELVWRGSASARLASKTTPEKSEKRINEAVTKILERFPPHAKAKGA